MMWKTIWTAFQVYLYRGSGVSHNQYMPLLQCLQQQCPNITGVQFLPNSFFSRHVFEEDSVLIGQSFGGYFALKDAIEDKKSGRNLVRSVVLLNSHFNSRRQVLYPSIRQQDLHIPVLTLVGDSDNRLPLEWSLPDLWESQEHRIKNRPFKAYTQHHHFSGISTVKTLDTVKISCDIRKFWEGSLNTTTTLEKYGFRPTREFMFPKGYDCRNSLSILDFMLSLFWHRVFWDWTHFVYFLTLSPSRYLFPHYKYNGDILVKSQHLSFESFCQHHKDLFFQNSDISYRNVSLPTNLIGLYQWLLLPTKTKRNTAEVFVLELPGNKTYYKIAHPEKFIRKNRLHQKNPFSFL